MSPSLLSDVIRLTDDELIARVIDLARHEREVTVDLVAHLAELDGRKLYLSHGCDSLFTYCVQVLRLSEHAAYGRIEAARAARKHPELLELLATGALNLTTLGILSSHLSSPRRAEILEAARFKSKRAVEKLVADLDPLPDVPATIRKVSIPRTKLDTNGDETPTENGSTTPIPPGTDLPLLPEPAGLEPSEFSNASSVPAATTGRSDLAPTGATGLPASLRSVIAPLGNERYKYQFTASAETHEKFLRAQALLRHAIPNGDVVSVIDRALTLLVKQLEKTRLAATDKPRGKVNKKGNHADGKTPVEKHSRDIPHELVRQVYERDGHRCTATAPDGRRCSRTDGLEIDHVRPWAVGGETRLENLRLLCWAHNRHAAERYYGADFIERRIEEEERRRNQAKLERRPKDSKSSPSSSADPGSGESTLRDAIEPWWGEYESTRLRGVVTDRVVTDRVVTDRVVTDRVVTDRVVTDRVVTDQAVGSRLLRTSRSRRRTTMLGDAVAAGVRAARASPSAVA